MEKRPRRTIPPWSRFAVFAAMAIPLFALYLLRPDGAQAIHWWPMAVWTLPVFLPFVTLRLRLVLRPLGLALLVWIGMLEFVGEPSLRLILTEGPRLPGTFRIVSLNCAGGTTAAAKEAFGQGGDLVVLQEVGSHKEFVRAGAEAGYLFVSWSVDDAVFSTRPLAKLSHGLDFAAADVDLGGRSLRIVALRLDPPVFRLDLWNPECWREYAIDAIRRRERMETLLPQGPAIVGGDFNTTNPRLVTDYRPEMKEAGRTVGRGLRGTGTNDFPVVWTDQIWSTPEVHWEQSFVLKTENSDHRMVVADFRIKIPLSPPGERGQG